MALPKASKRPIEKMVEKHYSWWNKTFVSIQKKDLKIWHVIFLIAFIAGSVTTMAWVISNKVGNYSSAAVSTASVNVVASIENSRMGNLAIRSSLTGMFSYVSVNSTNKNASSSLKYTIGDTLTITASDYNSGFVGSWGGDCASFGNQKVCTLKINTDKFISVSFIGESTMERNVMFDINLVSGSMGTLSIYSKNEAMSSDVIVTVAGPVIKDIGTRYVWGDVLTITAKDENNQFIGNWGGDCAGSMGNVCTLVVLNDLYVKATFNQPVLKTQTVSCAPMPGYAERNSSSTITQITTNGTTWLPSNVSSYNTKPGICTFVCKAGYSWINSKCIATVKTVSCTSIPGYAVRNSSSTIAQTSTNGTTWLPSNVSSYNIKPGICTFTCKPGYSWINSKCIATVKTVSCTSIPGYVQLNSSSTITQTSTNGTTWSPSNKSLYSTKPGICTFVCRTGYKWSGSACVK